MLCLIINFGEYAKKNTAGSHGEIEEDEFLFRQVTCRFQANCSRGRSFVAFINPRVSLNNRAVGSAIESKARHDHVNCIKTRSAKWMVRGVFPTALGFKRHQVEDVGIHQSWILSFFHPNDSAGGSETRKTRK